MNADESYLFAHALRMPSDNYCYDRGCEHHRYCCKHEFKADWPPYDIGTYCWQFTAAHAEIPPIADTRYCCAHKARSTSRKILSQKIDNLAPDDMRAILREFV